MKARYYWIKVAELHVSESNGLFISGEMAQILTDDL